jgi:hypothetical protein
LPATAEDPVVTPANSISEDFKQPLAAASNFNDEFLNGDTDDDPGLPDDDPGQPDDDPDQADDDLSQPDNDNEDDSEVGPQKMKKQVGMHWIHIHSNTYFVILVVLSSMASS